LFGVLCVVAAGMQFFTCWHSQRRNERCFHLAFCWGFGVLCLAFLPVTEIHGVHTASFVLLVLGVVGVFGVEGISVSYYLALMGGEKNVGVAIINTIGALGGFAGPYLIGACAHSTGNYYAALWLLSGCLALAAVNACKQPGLDASAAFISFPALQLVPQHVLCMRQHALHQPANVVSHNDVMSG
jgi:MFS family permease